MTVGLENCHQHLIKHHGSLCYICKIHPKAPASIVILGTLFHWFTAAWYIWVMLDIQLNWLTEVRRKVVWRRGM